MATDQMRIESLYARLYLTIIRFGLLIAAAWLFAAFSYYLSRKTGSDWFSQSGSVMTLVGATCSSDWFPEPARTICQRTV
jgi:hypothetical protein